MVEPADALVPVAMYDRADDAEQAAKALVARGIGAVVQRFGIDCERDPDTPVTATARVAVLAGDRARASEILGFADPGSSISSAEAKAKVPIGRVLLIFAVAMVVIPGLAFWLSYTLSQ